MFWMKATQLIEKYNVPGPRYTSYPTVPYWNVTQWEQSDWTTLVRKSLEIEENKHISLYIHLPYCDSLCTFCGCHKHITTNHSVESRYIDAVLKEWELISATFPSETQVEELHLGGGTPTFFSANELVRLVSGLKARIPFTEQCEMSFEAHPNSTSEEHLTKLRSVGFKRISFGIQDYDSTVQIAIHRIQTKEQVLKCHQNALENNYQSISHDLVFGLPKQTMEGFSDTVSQTLKLTPHRISLYSYAHVPWVKGTGQRGFDEADLPSPEQKRALYEFAKESLLRFGYLEVGMDHFALPTDALAQAMLSKKLNRNFMGYTTTTNPVLIGLGMSAISDCKLGFAQNEKSVSTYLQHIESGQLALTKGHRLNEADLEIRDHISNLMCRFETTLPSNSVIDLAELHEKLSEMVNDHLVSISGRTIRVLEAGIPFVRNCCMQFDSYLEYTPGERKFSMTI